jgi:hypothetical protein
MDLYGTRYGFVHKKMMFSDMISCCYLPVCRIALLRISKRLAMTIMRSFIARERTVARHEAKQSRGEAGWQYAQNHTACSIYHTILWYVFRYLIKK